MKIYLFEGMGKFSQYSFHGNIIFYGGINHGTPVNKDVILSKGIKRGTPRFIKLKR